MVFRKLAALTITNRWWHPIQFRTPTQPQVKPTSSIEQYITIKHQARRANGSQTYDIVLPLKSVINATTTAANAPHTVFNRCSNHDFHRTTLQALQVQYCERSPSYDIANSSGLQKTTRLYDIASSSGLLKTPVQPARIHQY